MQLDKVILDGKQLAAVDNIFASVRPDFRKSVTVNFTDGKTNDPRWGKEKKQTQGLTKPSGVNVDTAASACTGNVLIDLTEILQAAWSPAQKVGNQRIAAGLSSKQFRYLSVICVVHELMHVHQGWQLGSGFARAMFDEKGRAEIRATENAQENARTHSDSLETDAYLLNQFEQGARDFTVRWSSANSGDIHNGRFDFLLPMTTMRGIFPDKPTPF